jgi:hypothetical protein
MTSDLDLYWAAALLMKQHGEGAAERAQVRAPELAAAGERSAVPSTRRS